MILHNKSAIMLTVPLEKVVAELNAITAYGNLMTNLTTKYTYKKKAVYV
jgi:hypothetical protein